MVQLKYPILMICILGPMSLLGYLNTVFCRVPLCAYKRCLFLR